MKKSIILVLLFFIVITPFFFNYNEFIRTNDYERLISNIKEETPNILNKYKIPGAAIAIIRGDEIAWVGTFGYADIEAKKPIQEDTIFQVASISKPVTTLGIMKLYDLGKLDLDEPLEKYITRWELPESTYDKNKVTTRSVLSHSSGLSMGGGYPGYEPERKLPTLEESLSGLGGGSKPVELVYEPGGKYSYSGGGYNLMQLLIEEITEKDFIDYMSKEVLIPMGMTSSSFSWNEDLHGKTAKAYDEDLKLLPNYLFIEMAAAGLYTTIEDMSRFAITNIKSTKGNGFLKEDIMETMLEPVIKVNGLTGLFYDYMALGHFVNELEDSKYYISHDGANKGWRASFALAPKEGDAIIILTNGNNGSYLLNEVLNSWHFTVFNKNRGFDKIQHRANSILYSLGCILLLSSINSIFNTSIKLRNGKYRIVGFNNRNEFVFSSMLSLILIAIVCLLRLYLVPLLSFINPRTNIIFITVYIRTLVHIMQLFIKENNEVGANVNYT
ncbi:serine hydrolase domain-containing protein [Serpentinicella alkaliphila]|uniref:CubicO group peptidase (Beta-lactamase class C family) n=1 Tax=Serpentinicella alkaliphila TaxID=1734049 RepID=A0A4R2UCN4_9FIRM|nr:serine hydrolase domain-containing protein [Serpentinicella alkaliphila]QUH26807.1 beta-lactamase family protein [Serpentinicella alkaliphila]TCQ08029.1 CubicO group peptidase (beta-lactamase class C family) [Serpentinicella alkaliphila]